MPMPYGIIKRCKAQANAPNAMKMKSKCGKSQNTSKHSKISHRTLALKKLLGKWALNALKKPIRFVQIVITPLVRKEARRKLSQAYLASLAIAPVLTG